MKDPETGYIDDAICPTCREDVADCECPRLRRHWTWEEAVMAQEVRDAGKPHFDNPALKQALWRMVLRRTR